MASEIPLVGYAHSDWTRKRRAARETQQARVAPELPADAAEVPGAPIAGSTQNGTVRIKPPSKPALTQATLLALRKRKASKREAVAVLSTGMAGPAALGAQAAAPSATARSASRVPLRGGPAAPEEVNTRSVIPVALAQGRGIKPRKRPQKELYRVGDLKSHDSALVLAQEMLEARSLAAVELLVSTMQENIDDAGQQIKACAALGHFSAMGNENQLERSGQAHQQMYDFDIISPEMLRVQQSGAIAAVINAITAHTSDRRLVLRACWALEQMTVPIDNKRQFQFQGGESVLETLSALYREDPDISSSIATLRAPARTGKTWNAMKCCGRATCAVM